MTPNPAIQAGSCPPSRTHRLWLGRNSLGLAFLCGQDLTGLGVLSSPGLWHNNPHASEGYVRYRVLCDPSPPEENHEETQ